MTGEFSPWGALALLLLAALALFHRPLGPNFFLNNL